MKDYSELIAKIKDLRIELNYLIESVKEAYLNKFEFRTKYSIVVDRTEEGRMWLGKLLGALGAKYPYPESTNVKNKVIEAATDKADTSDIELFDDEILQIKAFRAEFEDIANNVIKLRDSINHDYMQNLSVTTAIQRITEAKMWLGMILDELNRDETDEEKV